jgi:putative endonuclease
MTPPPSWRDPSPRDFRSHPDTVGRGREGEAAATAWLRRQGYRIVARNYRTPAGEIDVVAIDPHTPAGETLCVVEIKARLDTRYGRAIEAVGARKQARLVRAARYYLAREAWTGPCRFDVLGLEAEDGEWRFDLVQDAFQAGG